MSRPLKNYCDYFPHDRDMRNHRKVKAIRQKFKATGYAIWNMLLEYLTGSDGNVFEYSDIELELMSGDFEVSVAEIKEVVEYCIKLEMLFLKDGFVHSESLDIRLKPVYDKREQAKEMSEKQKRANGKFIKNNTGLNGVSVTESTQSKAEQSELNQIELNNISGKEEILRVKAAAAFKVFFSKHERWKNLSEKFYYDQSFAFAKKYGDEKINSFNKLIGGWAGVLLTELNDGKHKQSLQEEFTDMPP